MPHHMELAEAIDRIKSCGKQLETVARFTPLPPGLARKLTDNIRSLHSVGAQIDQYERKVRNVHREQRR